MLERIQVKILGVSEDVEGARKEIIDFINVHSIRCVLYKPPVSQNIWNFLARQMNESLLQIAKYLERYGVAIQITDDCGQFLLYGSDEGVALCKQRLADLAQFIVERDKKQEYPGVKQLFLGSAGQEQLQIIKMELCVDIQIVQSREKRISKAAVPLPRTLSFLTQNKKVVSTTFAISRPKKE